MSYLSEKRIPFYSAHIPKDIYRALESQFDTGYISGGKPVEKFEMLFRRKFGYHYAFAVNSCTSALRLSLAVAGVKVGDEVISTPLTMMATNTAILEQGAKPVFADVRYETANIDPEDIKKRITKKTRAIMVVHLAGYPCEMDEIWNIALDLNIPVIEDAAHAIGTKYGEQYVGTLSDFCCFSLYATKHITTGDGGMVTTSKKKYAEKIEKRRWYGIDRAKRFGNPYLGYGDYDVKELGFKYNMNSIAAVMGIQQMKYIDQISKKRMEITKWYREELDGIKDLELFLWEPNKISGNWLFPIHVKHRLRFGKMMYEKGIECSIAYRRNDRYSIFGGFRKDLPNLDRLDKDMIYIPLHCDLTDEQIKYIIKTIKGGW